MDAFYASVEQVDFPEYRGKHVIIGASPGNRGVVAACSYEARKFGVHSAMPISQAYARCREGIYLPVRMERYLEISRQIMETFNDFTPEVVQISIDEAFLNMTGTEKLFGNPCKTAEKIKLTIKNKTGLNISIGIAHNKFLAKLASDYDKPDGLYEVKEGDEINFLNSIKLGDLWGLGKKTLTRLEGKNITTVKELRAVKLPDLKRIAGESSGEFLYSIVRGIDPGIYSGKIKNRSVSNEITFREDTENSEIIRITLLELAHKIFFRILESGEKGRTVQLKLRYKDFTTVTVRETPGTPINSGEELYDIAVKLLKRKWDGSTAVRLIGLGMSSLEKADTPDQIEMFSDNYNQARKVEQAVLKIKKRGNKLTKASLLNRKTRGE